MINYQKHNKYVSARKRNQEKEDSENFYKIVMDRLKEIRQEELKNSSFTWRWISFGLLKKTTWID